MDAEILALLPDDTDIGQTWNIVSLGKKERENLAFNFSTGIKRCLVRLVAEKIVTWRDLVSHFFVPATNDATLYRLPLTRHDDRCCHAILLQE